MNRFFEPLLSGIVNTVFPVSCPVCGKIDPDGGPTALCAACSGSVELITGLCCASCGTPLPDGGKHCFSCRSRLRPSCDSIRSAAAYRGPVKELIHKFKYSQREYLGGLLSGYIFDLVRRQPYRHSIDYVVPVPLHWFRKYRRGYNQSEILARRVGEEIRRPVLPDLLMRRRATRPQYRLSREERFVNIRNSFRVRRPHLAHNATLLLVDDVCTTSGTLHECARVLKQAGARAVHAVTVARD